MTYDINTLSELVEALQNYRDELPEQPFSDREIIDDGLATGCINPALKELAYALEGI